MAVPSGTTRATTSSGVTSGIDTGLLVQISKDYRELLRTLKNKTSNSKKLDDDPKLDAKVDATIALLEKQLKEVGELSERAKEANKLAESTKLSEVQKRVLLEEIQKDFSTTLKTFEKTPEQLTGFMKEFRNVAGATDLRRTFDSISTLSKRISEVTEYNRKIDASRKKLYNDIIGEDWSKGIKGLGESALYGAIGNAAGALGPFSALLKPVGSFLKKEAPTIISALKRKKKVNSPTEAEVLKNGGNEGKAIVWQTRELKKALRKDSGSLLGDSESSFGDFLEGAKDAALALWGLKNSLLTEAGLGSALKLALKGIIIGVSVKEFVGGAKEAIDGLLSGKSAREVGEDAGEGKSFWNPLIVPGVAGSATATTLWGAGQGFSEGFKFGLDTPGILPIAAAPSFGLYGAALGGTDNFINWFDGYSDSIDLSGPFKFAENLGIPGGKAIGTWGEWVDEGYSQYGNFLQSVWEQTKSLMTWSGSKGREAGEAMSLAFNGGIPLDSTGGLSDDTLKKLQTLWFLLQFDTYDAGKRGVLLKNLTSLGVSSDLIQTGLTPEEQTSLLSDYGAMEDQMASLKQEYADLLVSSAEFERRRDEVSEALGLGTEDNPVVVSLDEQSKQDIADNISKNASSNLVISGPGLNFDFSTLRV